MLGAFFWYCTFDKLNDFSAFAVDDILFVFCSFLSLKAISSNALLHYLFSAKSPVETCVPWGEVSMGGSFLLLAGTL